MFFLFYERIIFFSNFPFLFQLNLQIKEKDAKEAIHNLGAEPLDRDQQQDHSKKFSFTRGRFFSSKLNLPSTFTRIEGKHSCKRNVVESNHCAYG